MAAPLYGDVTKKTLGVMGTLCLQALAMLNLIGQDKIV